MKLFSVVFVCMGNLCRSPSAHGVFRQRVASAGLAAQVRIDSAGTHATKGERADARAQACARQHGYDLSDLRSRPVVASDFELFDLLLAMDENNESHLRRRCPPPLQQRVRRLTEFCLHPHSAAVPDPYYSNAQGFEQVLALIEDACDGLLAHVQQQLNLIATTARS
ncbi:low molecular weight protein-tyrosine-phosphatase [Simplicispira psychrophila]|uniref:low molecular weight protein-tyrosine-phosphatase n=1 Tax=Simplicispira psychrophila TaxID=80882 RepID=UPI00048470CF|nr:low molecular weight protein-tyrosine-phosphatase [Simplicispira psychrophila]